MATFSVRVDDKTKKAFDNFCEASGLTLSCAINIFMKAVVKENRIPFEVKGEEISSDPFWHNEENLEHLRKSLKQMEEGKCSEHELIEGS